MERLMPVVCTSLRRINLYWSSIQSQCQSTPGHQGLLSFAPSTVVHCNNTKIKYQSNYYEHVYQNKCFQTSQCKTPQSYDLLISKWLHCSVHLSSWRLSRVVIQFMWKSTHSHRQFNSLNTIFSTTCRFSQLINYSNYLITWQLIKTQSNSH